MANTNINIRMDSNLKKEFEGFCDDIGISMTTAFTIFAKQTLRENRIPFEITRTVPNKETLEAINAIKTMKKDQNLGKTYNNVDEMMADLLSNV